MTARWVSETRIFLFVRLQRGYESEVLARTTEQSDAATDQGHLPRRDGRVTGWGRNATFGNPGLGPFMARGHTRHFDDDRGILTSAPDRQPRTHTGIPERCSHNMYAELQ